MRRLLWFLFLVLTVPIMAWGQGVSCTYDTLMLYDFEDFCDPNNRLDILFYEFEGDGTYKLIPKTDELKSNNWTNAGFGTSIDMVDAPYPNGFMRFFDANTRDNLGGPALVMLLRRDFTLKENSFLGFQHYWGGETGTKANLKVELLLFKSDPVNADRGFSDAGAEVIDLVPKLGDDQNKWSYVNVDLKEYVSNGKVWVAFRYASEVDEKLGYGLDNIEVSVLSANGDLRLGGLRMGQSELHLADKDIIFSVEVQNVSQVALGSGVKVVAKAGAVTKEVSLGENLAPFARKRVEFNLGTLAAGYHDLEVTLEGEGSEGCADNNSVKGGIQVFGDASFVENFTTTDFWSFSSRAERGPWVHYAQGAESQLWGVVTPSFPSDTLYLTSLQVGDQDHRGLDLDFYFMQTQKAKVVYVEVYCQKLGEEEWKKLDEEVAFHVFNKKGWGDRPRRVAHFVLPKDMPTGEYAFAVRLRAHDGSNYNNSPIQVRLASIYAPEFPKRPGKHFKIRVDEVYPLLVAGESADLTLDLNVLSYGVETPLELKIMDEAGTQYGSTVRVDIDRTQGYKKEAKLQFTDLKAGINRFRLEGVGLLNPMELVIPVAHADDYATDFEKETPPTLPVGWSYTAENNVKAFINKGGGALGSSLCMGGGSHQTDCKNLLLTSPLFEVKAGSFISFAQCFVSSSGSQVLEVLYRPHGGEWKELGRIGKGQDFEYKHYTYDLKDLEPGTYQMGFRFNGIAYFLVDNQILPKRAVKHERTIKVVDSEGAPVVCDLEVLGQQYRLREGEFLLREYFGQYDVRVTASGYVPKVEVVTVDGSTGGAHTIVLERLYSVSFQLKDRATGGAVVYPLMQVDGKDLFGGADGQVAFSTPKSRFSWSVLTLGYAERSGEVDLSKLEEPYVVDIELDPILEVLFTVNDAARGEIEGEARQRIGVDGVTSVVTAKAKPGYQFVQWSDGVKDARREPFRVTESQELIAYFDRGAASEKTLRFGDLRVHVVDLNGTVPEGVQIRVEQRDAERVLADGTFSVNLPYGTYRIAVTHDDYYPLDTVIRLGEPVYKVEFVLMPLNYRPVPAEEEYVVYFAVRDWAGSALEQVQVEVKRDGEVVETLVLGRNGDGKFSLKPGKYSYTVKQVFYHDAIGEFEIVNGDLRIPVTLVSRSLPEGVKPGGVTAVVDDLFAGIRFYPNPVDDVLYVRGVDGIVRLDVCTPLGQLVRSVDVRGSVSSIDLSLRGFASGVYIVRVVHVTGQWCAYRIIKK